MATLKKMFKDQLFDVPAAALREFQTQLSAMENVFAIVTDEPNVIRSNLPTIPFTDENGDEQQSPCYFVNEETGEYEFYPEALAEIGSLAIITHYGTAFIQPDGQGEPLAVPTGIFLLNLPAIAEVTTSKDLTTYITEMVKSDLLRRARKMARMVSEGKTQLTVDRIAALLSVAGRTSSGTEELSYKIMFPILQSSILAQVGNVVERLKAAGKHAKARTFAETYGKGRLNRDTLRMCLSSKEAAEQHFSAIPQAQWEALLKGAIRMAPRTPINSIVKDDAGKSMKAPDGTLLRQTVVHPLSPTIFERWLATRNVTILATEADDETFGLAFDGILAATPIPVVPIAA